MLAMCPWAWWTTHCGNPGCAAATPASARGFGLSLYHCLSQVQDAQVELERYTMGYVDSYLRDGREMLRDIHALKREMIELRKSVWPRP